MEASRLRQKAEELVKDSELLPTPSPSLASYDHLAELTSMRGARWAAAFPQTPNSRSEQWSHSFRIHSETHIASTGPEATDSPPHCVLSPVSFRRSGMEGTSKSFCPKVAGDSALQMPWHTLVMGHSAPRMWPQGLWQRICSAHL